MEKRGIYFVVGLFFVLFILAYIQNLQKKGIPTTKPFYRIVNNHCIQVDVKTPQNSIEVDMCHCLTPPTC